MREERVKKIAKIETRKIENYLQKISSETNLTKAKRKSDDDQIIQSSIIIGSYKYAIIVITETIVHLLQYILAMQFNIYVNRYKEILIISKKHKIIPPKLSNNLQPFINFRNMLVHHYWKVDDDLFLKNLRDGIQDFQNFVNTIKTFMQDISQKSCDSE